MKTNDGGPAFPLHPDVLDVDGNAAVKWISGMSLRDWFAGQVIAGWFASDEGLRTAARLPSYAESAEYDLDYIARQAFKLADAMLKAREQ